MIRHWDGNVWLQEAAPAEDILLRGKSEEAGETACRSEPDEACRGDSRRRHSRAAMFGRDTAESI